MHTIMLGVSTETAHLGRKAFSFLKRFLTAAEFGRSPVPFTLTPTASQHTHSPVRAGAAQQQHHHSNNYYNNPALSHEMHVLG